MGYTSENIKERLMNLCQANKTKVYVNLLESVGDEYGIEDAVSCIYVKLQVDYTDSDRRKVREYTNNFFRGILVDVQRYFSSQVPVDKKLSKLRLGPVVSQNCIRIKDNEVLCGVYTMIDINVKTKLLAAINKILANNVVMLGKF